MKKLAVCVVMALLPWGHTLAAETLPEVVVTAERMGVDRKDEPQAVEVITAKDFERQGAGNVSEALAGALSLDLSAGAQNATSAMGGHQAQIRGMNTNHTLILVDGRRLADEDTSQTQNMYLLDRIDLSTVDRIEILRGPAGAMYGSDAMGGVIQIITKKPGRREASAGYRLSSRENETHFRIDPGALGRFSFAVSGRLSKLRPISFRQNKTVMMGAPGGMQIPMQYDGNAVPTYGVERYISFDSLYNFQNHHHNVIRWNLDYFHEDTTFSFADASMVMGRPIPAQQDEKNKIKRTEWNTGLSYEGDTGRNIYHVGTYYSRMKKDSVVTNQRGDFGRRMPPGILQSLETLFPKYDTDNAIYERWGMNAWDTAELGTHQLTFGSEYEKNTYVGTRLLSNEPGADKQLEGHEQHHGAFYVSDFWKVNDRLTLTPSFRMERGNTYGFVGTPRLGVTYALDAHTRIKANYGKGFRAPTVSERYLRMNHGFVLINGNPDLSPEKSQNFDISLEWERGKTTSKLSYFQNRVTNLIDTVKVSDGGMIRGGLFNPSVYTYQNVKRALIRGVEAELSHALGRSWTARAGYTYLDAQDKSAGSRLENRARHQMTVYLDYDDGAPYGWSGKLWDTFEDSYYFDSQSYTYHLLNLSVQKHWGKALTLSAGLYNIGNKKIDDLYVDGREWFCGMEMKF